MTERHLIPWAEKVAAFSAREIGISLGRIKNLWLSSATERDASEEIWLEMSSDDRIRLYSKATEVHTNHLACIPFSLNTLGDEPDRPEEPLDSNAEVFPALLSNDALVRFTLQAHRSNGNNRSVMFSNAPGDTGRPFIDEIKKQIVKLNRSTIAFAPDNGGNEQGQPEILTDYWRGQLSFLALFRGMRYRATELGDQKLEREVIQTWHRMTALLYKIRKKVQLEYDPHLNDLPDQVAVALFDCVSGASATPFRG